PPRAGIEGPYGSPHQAVVVRFAPAGHVECTPAREQVEQVVRVEDLRAPAEDDQVDTRLCRRPCKADELAERSYPLCRQLGTAPDAEDVQDLRPKLRRVLPG